jgi:hypothetical protein
VFAFIVTITGRYICNAWRLTVIATITTRSKCTAYSYCDNNGEVYMQC